MPKKLKTETQILALQNYFNKKQDKWPKKQLISLAKGIGLSRSQVYKWLWDQRNLMKQHNKNEALNSNTDSFTKNEKIKFQALAKKTFNSQKYRDIILKTGIQEIPISVPENMQFCCKFVVSSKISSWALCYLRKHGFQLTRVMNQSYHEPYKVKGIEEFNQVKEEY